MRNKKHILFISSWYPNRTNLTHGIFNRFFAEAAAIYNKISVLHVCSDENLTTDTELVWHEEPDITTLIVYYKKVKGNFFIAQLTKRRRLLNAFEMGYKALAEKNGKPNLIQLNVIMPAGLGAQRLSKRYNIPYIINEGWTGYCPEDGNYKGFIHKLVTRRIVASAKRLMPVSNYLKNAMLAHGLTGNYVVVPNVVDVNLFAPQPKPAEKMTRYLHISTLDEAQKNVSGIIRAFAAAHKLNADTELTIIGKGPEKEMLQRLVDSLGLSAAIKFTGLLTLQQVVDKINASDALLMFSNYESFSLVVAEALACGKPVITSRAGGLTDVITPELGISVEKKNEAQLTKAITTFAQHKTEYNSTHIRNFVTANYSKEKIGEQLNTIYTGVLLDNKDIF